MTDTPALYLFDDARARAWEPFALTRPAGELLFGALTPRARAERVLGLRCVGHVVADHLEGFAEDGAPPVVPAGEIPDDRPRVFLSARAVPAWEAMGDWMEVLDRPGRAACLKMAGRCVGWFAPAGTPGPDATFFDDPEGAISTGRQGPAIEVDGRLLDRVWELALDTPDQLGRDIPRLAPHPTDELPAGVYRVGDGNISLGAGVRVEPGVVLDATAGPIWLDRGVTVRAFTRLAGPAYIGPGSTLLGGAVEAVSTGPVCKLRGELAESVCLGYVNKAHDGHIGHAYLGRWVNLGAGTTNSDLKNNYGSIRVWTPDGLADTGRIKLGCLLGDHVKTGIGLLLDTGTVVGAGSNLFGAAMPPKWVPPFRWGSGRETTAFKLDKFLEVALRAMERRNVTLSGEQREQLRAAWRRGCEQAEHTET